MPVEFPWEEVLTVLGQLFVLLGIVAGIGWKYYKWVLENRKTISKNGYIQTNIEHDYMVKSLLDHMRRTLKDSKGEPLVISVAALTNSDKPTRYKLIASTDNDTMLMFNESVSMENALLDIHYHAGKKGWINFYPEQLRASKVSNWYKEKRKKINGEESYILQTYTFIICEGVFSIDGEDKKAQIVIYINFDYKELISPTIHNEIYKSINILRGYYKAMSQGNYIDQI